MLWRKCPSSLVTYHYSMIKFKFDQILKYVGAWVGYLYEFIFKRLYVMRIQN